MKGKGFGALAFYRMISKIGHAFTVAELGIGAFSPTLLNLIKGELPLFASRFVLSEAVLSTNPKAHTCTTFHSTPILLLPGTLLWS